MEMIFRNVGEEKMKPYDLLLGLSVVWDGKEYGRDPKQFIAYNGLLEFGPKSGWRNRISLSEFLIPSGLSTSGRHTVAVRDGSAASNTQIMRTRSFDRKLRFQVTPWISLQGRSRAAASPSPAWRATGSG